MKPRPRSFSRALLALLTLLWASVVAAAGAERPAHGLATPHPLATEVGEEVLAKGGNAFDAAVAVAAVLGVVEPYGSGLGGGGFWLLHDADSGAEVMVDARERAPLAATPGMFLDEAGQADRDQALNHPLAAAIPGQPAALDHIAEAYGSRPLAELLRPAVDLARDGFEVDGRYERLVGFRADVLDRWGQGGAIFLDDEGGVPGLGHRIHQPELAATLERLGRHGRQAFYDGAIAERLVAAVRAAGGIWSRRDLRAYEIIEREPIIRDLGDLRLVSAPPPSSGGIALAQMLALLDQGARADADADEVERIHWRVEAMRRAYHDRARYLGDPDFVAIPRQRLIDPAYAAGLAATIRSDRATPSEVFPGPSKPEGRDTTHFSIVDRHGNRVAATLSLNYPFGSGFVPEGTGVVLNNHMDDFTVQPGEPNAYGLIQGQTNQIEPGKRMLSSMSPTFLEQGRRVALLGTPGGSRIISTVLLMALEFRDGAVAREMVERPRYHHQYLPDRIEYEPDAFAADIRDALAGLGHELHDLGRDWGNGQVVVIEADGRFTAAADPRGVGSASARGRLGHR